MTITPDTHLFNIQLAFSEHFPKLKIDFFKSKHDKNELSSINDEMMEDFVMKDVNPEFKGKVLIFLDHEKVSEFEQRMEQDFGLHIQVFRKSNIIWIQTSTTDDWTLQKQMEHAI